MTHGQVGRSCALRFDSANLLGNNEREIERDPRAHDSGEKFCNKGTALARPKEAKKEKMTGL
jgi:hypothetical protein